MEDYDRPWVRADVVSSVAWSDDMVAQQLDSERTSVLRDYADGKLGTSEAIEKLGLSDFADLLVALSREGLLLPKPDDTAERRANVERARAILQPLLRVHGD